ncbi:hypothetical protein GIB67_031994 [Kingdonia uniflora]|uniref:Uncharacterized protein n=1 Tax=Kingdonia uniflora TaxID=39325 RepID=A0A7J7MWG5_9MAGN|nr:hypothetical protein GIB67_031994 [Kingdonia uniflora]
MLYWIVKTPTGNIYSLFNHASHNFSSSFRERVPAPKDEQVDQNNNFEKRTGASIVSSTLENPSGSQQNKGFSDGNRNALDVQSGINKENYSARSLLKSANISGSKCAVVKRRKDSEDEPITEQKDEGFFYFLLGEDYTLIKVGGLPEVTNSDNEYFRGYNTCLYGCNFISPSAEELGKLRGMQRICNFEGA